MKTVNVTNNTKFIIAGIDEGRERYLQYAKSTPTKTFVQWTDDKDEAHDLESLDNAQSALEHLDLPMPCVIVIRHDVA
jgi:hypothetical protein